MKKYIVYLCIASLTLSGCKKDADGVGLKSASSTEIPADPNGLSLNDEQKWIVNREMGSHFEAMESDIRNFIPSDDIVALQSRLQDNISQLTSKCTMKGQAHDELHKWLVPVIKTVETMDVQNPEEIIETLKEQFETYHLYFELES